MKQKIFIFLILICKMNAFSQIILIQKESDTIIAKKDKIISLPVRVCIPSNQVLYNFSNYAELNSDNKNILNNFLDGLVYHLFNPTYITQWGKGIRVLNLKCLTLDSDSLRLKYDTRRNQILEFNIYNELYENRLCSTQIDSCFYSNIFLKTPSIEGNFKLYLIYGQGSLGVKLSEEDKLIKNNDINVFKGLIFSDTIDIKIE